MHHFQYRGNALHAENVAISEIAAQVGTPFYCYSAATLTRHYEVLRAAFGPLDPLICYSVKANSNLAVLKLLADAGAGMDVVSHGELLRALAVGADPAKIIFAGVGKKSTEMAAALDAGIHSFNVESLAELHALSEVAQARGQTARVALRINPDVDPQTHAKISTGQADTKFGIAYAEARESYRTAAALPNLQVCGVHMHIGSQLTKLEPFDTAFQLMRDLILALRADGHVISHADLGGGIGVPYDTAPVGQRAADDWEVHGAQAAGGVSDVALPMDPADYVGLVRNWLGDLDLQLAIEPGRMIAANAGILVAEVIYEKANGGTRFVICDAAMNDLIRPTLYDAEHGIQTVELASATETQAMLVGPVCETGDYLSKSAPLPALEPGDLLAIMSAGAYGAVQAGTYNTRPLVPEVLVQGDKYAVVRRRPTYQEMLDLDSVPDWLT